VPAEIAGRLVRRYKRFLADVETEAGESLTVHCPNPGSMLGLDAPGSPVRLSRSDDPRRKLPHTLEMVRVGRTWVGLHTGRANALVERALAAAALPSLAGYAECRREVAGGSRLDFRLDGGADGRPCYVEVKSVTLARARAARFPDSVTLRGRRHLEALARLRRRGVRAVLLFLVQRGDCDWIEPADDIDPGYGKALRRAARAGVELLGVRARVGPRAIRIERRLPVRL
jgi:sugar fermentation stimulation protein A